MKLNQTAKVFETNTEVESQDFTIGDVSVVIEILRNKLYRHKVRTLVQEYISNGRDAMREISSKGKVDIVLPTAYEPTFKVRDYGPGISPDRMYNVFIKYASSTKRKNNLQTGGFGIGAKSAWSYTESFTIVTFIDGVQRTYVAHIGANNNGRLDYLGETKTKEPNGTEIQIPVSPKDIGEFKESAFRAVYFWDKSEYPVFKNVPQDELDQYEPGDMLNNLEVNNGLPNFIIGEYDTGMVLSIDGIPYVLGKTLSDKIPSLKSLGDLVTGQLVLHLKNGAIEVAASREEVADSKQTQDALESVASQTLGVIKTKLAKEFSKATTPFEHLTIFMRLKDLYNLNDYRKFAQFEIPDDDDEVIQSDLLERLKIERCEMPAPKFDLKKEQLNKKRRRSWRYSQRKASIKQEYFGKMYFIDGTDKAINSNYRLKALLQSNPEVIVMSLGDSGDKVAFDIVTKALGVIDLNTIPFVKPERKSKETIKVERSKQEFVIQDLGRSSDRAITISLASNKRQWLWIPYDNSINKADYEALSDYISDSVCALSADAQRRVKGDPNFKPLKEWLAKYKVSKKDIATLKFQKNSNNTLMEKLKLLTGLTDKFLNKMLKAYNFDDCAAELPVLLKSIVGEPDEVKQFVIDDKDLKQVLATKYPLLVKLNFTWDAAMLPEIVSYMNSKK